MMKKIKKEKIQNVLAQFDEARKEQEKKRLEEAERTQLKLKIFKNNKKMSLEVTNPAQTTYNFYVSIKKFI